MVIAGRSEVGFDLGIVGRLLALLRSRVASGISMGIAIGGKDALSGTIVVLVEKVCEVMYVMEIIGDGPRTWELRRSDGTLVKIRAHKSEFTPAGDVVFTNLFKTTGKVIEMTFEKFVVRFAPGAWTEYRLLGEDGTEE